MPPWRPSPGRPLLLKRQRAPPPPPHQSLAPTLPIRPSPPSAAPSSNSDSMRATSSPPSRETRSAPDLFDLAIALLRACEVGSKYAELAKEKADLSIDLEATENQLLRIQTELKTLGDSVKKALEDKDSELAAAQKVAKEKTEAAEKKLSAFEKLEEENKQLKKEKTQMAEKYAKMKERKAKMEELFKEYTEQMYIMLDEFCADFEEETQTLEPKLDPTKSLTGDACMMNTYRLEARLENVQGYISRLKEAVAGIDKELWPEDTRLLDLEPMMTRLQGIPSRVQAWKKSAARCGADVALALVRVHCKEVREDKLKNLPVANTTKLQFEDFLETFIAAATWIANDIDLDTFVEPASP